MLQGVTRGYKWLETVTRGYNGLQRVTRRYKGLHRVTEGLQGVKKGYKGLKWNIKRRKSFFHDLFSRSMTWEYWGLQRVTGAYKG